MERRVYNFGAGPATLPLPVLKEAQRELLNFRASGMSVLELSHRSSWFSEIIETAQANLRTLLNVPEHYHILFLQGGASLQFSMLALNLLHSSSPPADYVVTGTWGNKALAEAQRQGQVNVAWDGKAEGYTRVPEQQELSLNADATYVHFTSNETIQGVQFQHAPLVGGVPLVCDLSSDFLSRPLEVERYALLYGGAQKNVGGAGVTIVIVRDDVLATMPEDTPSMLNYRLLAEKNSLYNTPPTFAIYVVMLVTGWLLEEVGGLERMDELNRQKAQVLYEAIDHSQGFYRGHAQGDSRSSMNVTWRLRDTALEAAFVQQAQARDLVQLKGHRSVGGIRASIYNAMPSEGVQALRDFMDEFAKQNG